MISPATDVEPSFDVAPCFGVASWRALGTYVQVVVDDDAALDRARAIAESVLADVDRTCSRFRPDSDLVRANAAAGTWVHVDPLLAQAVSAALDAARVTGGLVDPTLGADLVVLGYDADLSVVRGRDEQGRDTDPAALPRTPRTAGWSDVEVDPDGAVLVPAGLALDLGATAKAWAADLVAAAVVEGTGAQVVVSLGGDVATGLPDDDLEQAVVWQVDVAELPDQPTQERVSLQGACLATSSTQARRWKHAGRVVHHLIDPRTGGPLVQEIYRTVSVIAPTCLQANTASTAALVLGEAAPAWLSSQGLSSQGLGSQGLGARLVDDAGNVTRTKGWPL